MTRRRFPAVLCLTGACLVLAAAAMAQDAGSVSSDLRAAIDRLGSFDFETRTEAARFVRRAAPDAVVPALDRTARSHGDEYVRFRALVILTGFGDAAAGNVMRAIIADRNDRLRTVAYQWFEHHPDMAVLPVLLDALPAEKSEFVRPALTRAIAAHGADGRAREALTPLIMRGEDLFRGALIEAMGDYNARYALPHIVEVAKLDGPLQDDAITAIGKIADASVRSTLAALQRTADDNVQPTISAAFCLVGIECAAQEAYLKKTLVFAARDPAYQPLLRGVVHALGVLAARGRAWALTSLLDAGVPATDPARASIALGVGLVALRDPVLFLRTLEGRPDAAAVASLMQDAFDMLSEDFEEERFSVEVRQVYWKAPTGSSRRNTAGLLIEKLEF